MRTLILLALLTSGCAVLKEQRTEIVRKAEACGAGDLTGASGPAMQDWFSRHRSCAITIDQMCRPVRQSAPARWADSTEGQVCTAAASVTQWTRKPNADRERFQAGWK